MIVDLLLLLAAVFQGDPPVRLHAEAAWSCVNLQHCRDWRLANAWLKRLRAGPGSQTKMRLGYGVWGNGLRRLDFWLMTASDPGYLRFDAKRGYLVVDDQAKESGEEIPLVIPPAEKPFPDWKGPRRTRASSRACCTCIAFRHAFRPAAPPG